MRARRPGGFQPRSPGTRTTRTARPRGDRPRPGVGSGLGRPVSARPRARARTAVGAPASRTLRREWARCGTRVAPEARAEEAKEARRRRAAAPPRTGRPAGGRGPARGPHLHPTPPHSTRAPGEPRRAPVDPAPPPPRRVQSGVGRVAGGRVHGPPALSGPPRTPRFSTSYWTGSRNDLKCGKTLTSN